MHSSNTKVIYMLWAVITVLVVGMTVGGFALVNHANTIDVANTQLKGDNASLHRQLDQIRAAPKVTPEPLPTPGPASTSTPAPTATPKPKI